MKENKRMIMKTGDGPGERKPHKERAIKNQRKKERKKERKQGRKEGKKSLVVRMRKRDRNEKQWNTRESLPYRCDVM